MTKTDFNKIWCIDLEATCWEPKQPSDPLPEIIEIGQCWLHSNGVIERLPRLFVRPTESKILSEFCRDLTKITQAQVSTARPLNEVINTIQNDLGVQNHPCAAFGYYDQKQIINECIRKAINFRHNPNYFNVKALHQLFTKSSKGVGLTRAVNQCGLEFIGQNHNGSDDAFNAARILKHHLKW